MSSTNTPVPDAGKTTIPDNILGQFAEKALDQVQPGRTGRGEVDVKTPMADNHLRTFCCLCVQ